MTFNLVDRCQETSTTENTGTISLAGAVAGFQTFAAVGDGNTCFYTITDADTDEWEVGQGVYNTAGPTLTRNLVASSTGALIDWSAGTRNVFVSYPAHAAALTTAVKTSHYTATVADSIIMVNPAAATTITLPTAAAGTLGQRLKVHKVAGDYVVTVTDGGSALVDGLSNQYLYLAGDSLDLLCAHNGSAYIWLALSRDLKKHSASLRQTSTQTPSSGYFRTEFDTIDFEYGAAADLANERIEIKRPGVYDCFAFVSFSDVSTGWFNVYLGLNGYAADDLRMVGVARSTGNAYVEGSVILDLAAGDVVYAVGWHNEMGGANSTIVSSHRLQPRLQVSEV